MTNDRDALILACLANPLDDAPRMVLTDYLEESNWGDPLMLSALRGEGDWYVSAWGEVVYRFSLAKKLETMYSSKNATLVIDYGYEWQGKADLVFGKVENGPKCKLCSAQLGLVFKHNRWECARDCTRSTSGYPGYMSMAYGTILPGLSVGITTGGPVLGGFVFGSF